jgi:hypothetical protein
LILAGVTSVDVSAQSADKPSTASTPEIFVVSSVAYRDLEKRLLANRRGNTKEQQYASDIRNYDVKISSNDDTYTVIFTLRPLHGTEFFGGVERYVLNGKTHAILEHSGEK